MPQLIESSLLPHNYLWSNYLIFSSACAQWFIFFIHDSFTIQIKSWYDEKLFSTTPFLCLILFSLLCLWKWNCQVNESGHSVIFMAAVALVRLWKMGQCLFPERSSITNALLFFKKIFAHLIIFSPQYFPGLSLKVDPYCKVASRCSFCRNRY